MANSYDFSGRVALVTGGASGIGAATAERLRASGAEVAVFDREPVEGYVSVTGDISSSALQLLDGFPKGWHQIPVGDPNETAAAAAADPVLAPPAATGKQGIFTTSSDYIAVGAYDKGGGKHLPGWNHPPDALGFFHDPHYFVVVVQKVKPQVTVPGQAPPKPVADPAQPFVSVVMTRDLGNVRQKPVVVGISSAIIFGICCYVLHRRDKQAWAAKGAALEPVGRE
jgi:hypothetical protein